MKMGSVLSVDSASDLCSISENVSSSPAHGYVLKFVLVHLQLIALLVLCLDSVFE